MSRKHKIILTVSVMLNVLLLGLSGGMLYKKWQWKSGHFMAENFSPEARNVIARTFQNAHREMRDEFEQFRALRKKLTALLRAKNIDEEAYEATSKKLQALQMEMMSRKMEMMKELALELPPEERKKISGRFMRPHGKRGYQDKSKTSDSAK